MIEVLVVDDDFMVAKIHTGFVERTPGFTVAGVAHTGAEALAEAERLQPDLVLLDVYLPDVAGSTCSAQLREAAPEVDVLVITAAREAETVRRALRGGIVHYLMKPFSYDDLRVRLEHYQQAVRGDGRREHRPGRRRPGLRHRRHRQAAAEGVQRRDAQLVEETLRDAPQATCPRRRRPACSGSPGSARGATSSTSTETARSRSPCATARSAVPERRYAWR